MSDADKDYGPFIGGLKVQRGDKGQTPNPPPVKYRTMRRAPNPRAPEIEASSGPANQGHTARNAAPLQGVLIGSLDESQEGESNKPGSSVPQNLMDMGSDNEKDFSWKPLVTSPSDKAPAESEDMELVSLTLPSRAAKEPAGLKGKTAVSNDPFAALFQDMTRPRSLGTGSNAPSSQTYADVLRRPTLGTKGISPPASQPSVALARPVYLGTMKSLTSVPSGSGLTKPDNLRVKRDTRAAQHVPSLLDDPIGDLNCPVFAPIAPVTPSAGMTSQGTLATTNAPSVPGGVDVTSPSNLGGISNASPAQRVSISDDVKDDLDSIFGPVPPVTATAVASPGNLRGTSNAQPAPRVSILDDAKDDLDLLFGPAPPVTASSAVTSSGTSGSKSNANPVQQTSIQDDAQDDLECLFGPIPPVTISSAATSPNTSGNMDNARPVQYTAHMMDRTSPLDRALFGSTAPVTAPAAVTSSGNQEKQKGSPWVLRGLDVIGDDSLKNKPKQPSAGPTLGRDTAPGDTRTANKTPSATRYSDSFAELQEAFKKMKVSLEHTHRRSSAPSNYDSALVASGPGPIPHSASASPAMHTRASNDLNAGNVGKDYVSSSPSVNMAFSGLLTRTPPRSLPPSSNRTGDSELSDKDEISAFVPRGVRHATRTGDLDEQGSENNGPPSRDSSAGGFQTPTTSEGDNQGVAVPQNDTEE